MPPPSRQAYVEHGDVRAQRRAADQCVLDGIRVADHRDVRLGVEQVHQAPTYHLVVVQQGHADRVLLRGSACLRHDGPLFPVAHGSRWLTVCGPRTARHADHCSPGPDARGPSGRIGCEMRPTGPRPRFSSPRWCLSPPKNTRLAFPPRAVQNHPDRSRLPAAGVADESPEAATHVRPPARSPLHDPVDGTHKTDGRGGQERLMDTSCQVHHSVVQLDPERRARRWERVGHGLAPHPPRRSRRRRAGAP